MANTIIKFRAGKVAYDPATKIAKPDAIQGEIVIKPSEEEDSFYSFEWKPKERTATSVERDEFLIIPGDATWTHIEECKTGRVFALSFLSSGARHLFWLQEVNDNDDDPSELSKKDKEVLTRIQKVLELEGEEEENEVEMQDAEPESSAQPAAV